MAGFKMNPNFERELKRELQKKLTKVSKSHSGRPPAEVAKALEREGFTVPEVGALSTAISEGREPKVE
ncbi:hypothetical protein P3H80_01125 [Mycolicibacterium septicum]|uniref:hypothetical protein n=1 Tax=Mycolicibacterium septicum TaxID=98668 RepID=UPI0023E171F4|nr:hypothetical protein [Mycolicibacterium septicum]MDF3336000.1 hypothetical protein [Mycolicibacterium septicum]